MGMLIIIPFITKIQGIVKPWSGGLATLVDRLDELTIIMFFPIAFIRIYRENKNGENLNLLYLLMLFPILIISLAGFISGMLNGNALLITALGTFEYVKFFLVIFIYAAFFEEFNVFQKIFRLLLIIAVFIGLVAFVQEAWVLCIRNIFERDIADNRIFIFISNLLNIEPLKIWKEGRLGIYRAFSLLSHYNLLGLYSLLILTIYLHVRKKVNYIVMFSLLAGIFASVSRTAYSGFALLAGLQIFKGRKWLIVFLIPAGVALFIMGFFGDDIKISELKDNENKVKYNQTITYREFARDKAMAVWKDHPIWGAGPGMFGGSVAFKYISPLYEEYNFTFILNWFRSLDQLWPQVLAEMGIAGAAALAGLFVSLLFVLFISRLRATSDELKNLFAGLSTFTVIFLIYTLSGNLNIVSILYPYCAFVGMGLGCLERPHSTGEIN